MELFGDRYRSATATAMVILDNDFDVGQMLLDRGFKVAKSDRLQPHVGVVEVLDWWLD